MFLIFTLIFNVLASLAATVRPWKVGKAIFLKYKSTDTSAVNIQSVRMFPKKRDVGDILQCEIKNLLSPLTRGLRKMLFSHFFWTHNYLESKIILVSRKK